MSQENLSELAERARTHAESIEQDVSGMEWYVVGGAIRDALLGLEPSDLDFVVVGETPETMEARGFEDIEASSFSVFHDTNVGEWALARTETKVGDGYKGFEEQTDDVSLGEDLERRDLTINSMALLVKAGAGDLFQTMSPTASSMSGEWELYDPNHGVGDAQNGMLRHVGPAFVEDPLRVLRVARYAARFAVPVGEESVQDYDDMTMHRFGFHHDNVIEPGFTVADETMDMMRRVAPELNRMSKDRIGTEVVKAMEQARRPSRFWCVLRDCGALAVIAPTLDRATIVPAGPPEHHAESLLN